MSDVTIGLFLMLAAGIVIGFMAGAVWTAVFNKAVQRRRQS